MDIKEKLNQRTYYNAYPRKFEHYYDTYFTNKDKIDRIVIDSLQKGFTIDQVLGQLDTMWQDCIHREKTYLTANGKPLTSSETFFEFYLQNVIRKIIVYDEFDKVFAGI